MPRITTPKSGVKTGQMTLSRFFSPKQKEGQENFKTPSKAEPTKDTKTTNTGSEETDGERPIKRTKFNDALDSVENLAAEQTVETPTAKTTTVGEEVETTLMSPDVMDMIRDKQIAAKIIRVSKEMSIVDKDIGKTWFEALEPEFKKDYFKQLNAFVTSCRVSKTVFPPAENVWEWTKQVPIKQVKVVILGQDPYHQPGQAHGLCFSVRKGVTTPPSLVNMYKELSTDIPGFVIPSHGCLTGWAQQGVLLLNAVLTVEKSCANAHKDKGWEKITDAVIRWISLNCKNVVFLLWGAYAQKKGNFVDTKKHYVLNGPHPSPLSAHRGFFGCQHFSKCNAYLEKMGKAPIDWNHLP